MILSLLKNWNRNRDNMAEKPTYQKFLNDLIECVEELPYGKEHRNVWLECQITVKCQEGTIVLRTTIQPSNIV
jgi:hypothetical protein